VKANSQKDIFEDFIIFGDPKFTIVEKIAPLPYLSTDDSLQFPNLRYNPIAFRDMAMAYLDLSK
jgi:hypothetical protein